MLRIRSEQVRAFQPQAENAFVERVAAYLKVNHAEELIRLPEVEHKLGELPKEILLEIAQGGIARARTHGFEWKSNLLSYVVLMVISAPNFDEHEKAKSFLTDENVPIEERTKKMMDGLTDEDWDLIEGKYDARAWVLPETETAEEQTV